nr:hypothetical protein JVH1_4168 [Rhodococcus sp. JVH1]
MAREPEFVNTPAGRTTRCTDVSHPRRRSLPGTLPLVSSGGMFGSHIHGSR